MANQYNANTPAKIQTLGNSIRSALGDVDMDFKDSVGMQFIITVANDGQSVVLETRPSDKGLNNRFGPVGPDGTRLTQSSPKIIPIANLP